MIHESKIAFTRVDDNGNDKVIKERYLIAEAESFGDAEEQTYDFCEGETGLDVIDVKRSKIKEILNSRDTGDDRFSLPTLPTYNTMTMERRQSLFTKLLCLPLVSMMPMPS